MNLFNLQKAHPSLTIVIARHLLYSEMHKKVYSLGIRETIAASQMGFIIMSREFYNFQKPINSL